MGGATFPAHFKYIEAMKKPADYVILNGAECEPYLTIDEQLMIEYPKEIVRGLEILLALTGAGKGFIGIEDNKPEAYVAMQKFQSEKIEPVLLKTKYPQGGEKQLIYSITKRVVPVGGYPINIGVIVNNVATAFAIFEAVEKGKPLFERGLSVTGEGIKNPNNYWVRIGTPIQQIIELAGGLKESEITGTQQGNSKVVLGGPMMGIPVKDLSVPVMKGTSGVLLLPPDQVHEIEEMPCINCGFCIFSCSLKLEPNYLVKLVKAKKFDDAYTYGVLNCCECGSCAYVCPSKIEHVKHFKLAKKLYTTLKGGKK
jgi:electron transport complex protein RnfC